MKAKKIVAPDMRQALKMVRDQMGPEAVILSNRKVANGVEVTAAKDYEAVLEAHRQKQRQLNHVPDYVDQQADIKVPQGDQKHMIKQSLLAAKEEAERKRAIQEASAEKRKQSRPFNQDMYNEMSGQASDEDWGHQPEIHQEQRHQRRPVDSRYHDERLEQQRLNRAEVPRNAPGRQQPASQQSPRREYPDYSAPARSAYDYDPEFDVEKGPHYENESRYEPARDYEPVARQAAQVKQTQTPDISEMRSELSQLRNLLNQQLGNVAWGDFSYRHPLSAAIFRRLTHSGLNVELCRSLLKSVNETAPKKEAWREVLVELSKRIPMSQDDIINDGGIVAFVGPAGVGKTTTIAKLAAQYALAHGPENLALITTDSYRIAGHEQLRTLAKILKVPLRVVSEHQPLDSIICGLSRKKMIMIDTAGLSAKDEAFFSQMNLFEKAQTPIKKWLVMSSTSQRRMLEKAANNYKSLNLAGCILTKLDESASLGEALSVIIDQQLPLSYTTDGQNIPDDLHRAKANQLVNLAMELSKEVQMDDMLMADVFSEARVAEQDVSTMLA